ATTATTGASTSPGGDRVVWSEAGDIWLSERSTGARRRLTEDGNVRRDALPGFHGPHRVTYVSWEEQGPGPVSVVRELDLTTGRAHDVARLDAWMGAFDWSPDGRTLAVYAAGDGTPGELRLVTPVHERTIRSFPPAGGRGGFINYDETRLEWSPDGRHLLLVDTSLDTSQDETFYVLTADGASVIAPRGGTWARWGRHGETVYCACAVHPGDDEWPWQAIDLGTGAGTPLPIERGMRPALSPDGRYLAFDDGEDTPSVHVLDVQAPGSRPRHLARGALAPLWLDAGHLAVTDTRPCADDEDTCIAGGHGSMFVPAGTASALDVASGVRSPTEPVLTEDADVSPSG
ncbi:MAG: hypothetical protein ACRDYV_19685, partial [Acidimicrobiia bacterium]